MLSMGCTGGSTCLSRHFLCEEGERGLQQPSQDGLRLQRRPGERRSNEGGNKFGGKCVFNAESAAAAINAAATGSCHSGFNKTSTIRQ
jgi:hypothetical protein